MGKPEEAIEKFRKGYNCCQAVACTFAEEAGVDEAVLYKVCEGFGRGMGTAQGVCGAVSGAAILAGLANSNGDIANAGKTKKLSMQAAGSIQREFVQRVGALACKDIKTGDGVKPYASCADCIRIAAEIAQDKLEF